MKIQPDRRTTQLERICSWCKQRQRIAMLEWQGVAVMRTHGICDACLDVHYAEGEEELCAGGTRDTES